MSNLGHEVIVSRPTTGDIFEEGVKAAHNESCLPVKVYMGHVRWLLERCDRILVPRVKDDSLCTRLWGMGDVVRHTFPGVKLLEAIDRPRSAFKAAAAAQAAHDRSLRDWQDALFREPGARILIASHPYVAHDPFIGGSVSGILAELGALVFTSDRFDGGAARVYAKMVSPRLGWAAGREVIGAAVMAQEYMDGVLLLSALPCAQDALVNEMTLRTLRESGIPATQIVLDGLQGEAGLRTRLESFMDIVEGRRKRESRPIGHHIPAHGKLPHPHRTGD